MTEHGHIGKWHRFALGACATLGAAIAFTVGWNITEHVTNYQARTLIAIVPTEEQSPAQRAKFWNSLPPPNEVGAMVRLLELPQTQAIAEQSAGVQPGSTTLKVELMDKTNLVTITADAPSSESADRILSAVLDKAQSDYLAPSGRIRLIVIQPNTPTDSGADPREIPVLIILTIAGALAGAGTAHVLRIGHADPGREPSHADEVQARRSNIRH